MNHLTVSRYITKLAATLLSLTQRVEAKAVGLHIRQLRQAKYARNEEVIESGRLHQKFVADQARRKEEIDAATRRAAFVVERKRHAAAVFNAAVSLEIKKYGHVE